MSGLEGYKILVGVIDLEHAVLLDPRILKAVFKHLDFTRLKLYRTVCRIWDVEIRNSLQDRTVTQVQTQQDCDAVVEILKKMENKKRPKLIQTLMQSTLLLTLGSELELDPPEVIQTLDLTITEQSMLSKALSLPVPITKLQITENVDCRDSQIMRRLHGLLLHCSSSLTSLKISCVIVSQLRIGKLDKELPNLEEISLAVREDCLFPPISEKAPLLSTTGTVAYLSKLINSAPKLNYLEIFDHVDSHNSLLDSFQLHKIPNLKIWTCRESGVAQTLKRTEFENLRGLFLSCYYQNFNQTDLEEMLQQNSESFESLYISQSCLLPFCPNLTHLSIYKFMEDFWDLSRFPTLNSVRIWKIDPELPGTFDTCPESVKVVTIGYEQELRKVSGALQELYKFFTDSATDWEVPYVYLEDFCDYFASDNNERKLVKRLTIGCGQSASSEFSWLTLAKGLEKISNLKGLEELTINNSQSSLNPKALWDFFEPNLLLDLHTITYFIHRPSELTALKKLASQVQGLKHLVLLNCNRICLDKRVVQALTALPNITLRYEEDIEEEIDVGHEG